MRSGLQPHRASSFSLDHDAIEFGLRDVAQIQGGGLQRQIVFHTSDLRGFARRGLNSITHRQGNAKVPWIEFLTI